MLYMHLPHMLHHLYCTTPQSDSTHMSRKPIPLPPFDVPQPCPGLRCWGTYFFTQNTLCVFGLYGGGEKKLFCFFCLWNESFHRTIFYLNIHILINLFYPWLCFRLSRWFSFIYYLNAQLVSLSVLTFWTELRRQNMDLVWNHQEQPPLINRNH